MKRPVVHVACLTLRLWLAAVVSLALAASALAHRAPITTDDLALAAFVVAGGSGEDFCGDPKSPHHFGTQGCDACRLVGAALVPSAPVIAPRKGTALRHITLISPSRASVKPGPRKLRHTPRAPPAG